MAEEVALASATTCEVTRSAHLELAELHLGRLTALEVVESAGEDGELPPIRVGAT